MRLFVFGKVAVLDAPSEPEMKATTKNYWAKVGKNIPHLVCERREINELAPRHRNSDKQLASIIASFHPVVDYSIIPVNLAVARGD